MAIDTKMNDIVKLAVDGYRGRVEKYSVSDSQEVLRKALIDLNNGSTKLNYKAIRDGKCPGLFSLIETILDQTVVDGLTDSDFFNALVDYRNVADGDQNLFVVDDNNLFIVDDAASGTQGVRRQRLGGSSVTSIPTSYKTVRIYEELDRVLSGRVDFNHLIDTVSRSIKQKTLQDIYTVWGSATANDLGGTTYFPTAGSYDEDTLLDLISHVEAAAGGKTATIIGTKKACRMLKEAIQSDIAKDELHELGYYGKFYGTPVIVTPQRHVTGTNEFVFDDDSLTIVAGDDKPIKFVYEGDSLISMSDPTDNADLTQEYFYATKYGLGIVLAGGNAGIGRYQTA